ncbi:Clp protease N-terminal domain-containing protein [Kribbella sp. NPDC049174]|uniref:Clp protease N-terminal domain-containing protein n=1 Tax=Kribbella sp. NPDC049174 TaxID=3364112 RepID=UPI00371AE150
MQFLDQYDVLAVAARVLRCESGDAVRRTDLDAVDQVLADVRRTNGLAEAAAVLLSGLIRARAFQGANRVVTVAVVLQFVAVNQADLRLEPVEDWDELLDRLTAAVVTPVEVADFIRARLTPQRVTAEDLQEHLRIELLLEGEVANLRASHALGGEELWRGEEMFEKFSDRARRVVVLAQVEAHQLQHNFIGTEHLLLGLIEEGQGVAAKVLSGMPAEGWRPGGMGVTAPAVRDLVVEMIGRGAHQTSGTVPFTPRAKSTLEHAYQEARTLGDDVLDTEHLLLGLLRDGEGVAAQILMKLGADLDEIRAKVNDWRGHKHRVESAVAGFLADDSGTAWTTFGRRHHLLAELSAVLEENERLHEQVAELRALLRRHDIDPDA